MMRLPDLKAVKNRITDFRRDVICMMRLKFICVAMAILIAVFLTMLTAINMIMNTVSRSQSMQLLRQIAESDRYNSVSTPEIGDILPPEPYGEEPPEFPTDAPAAAYSGEEGILTLALYGERPMRPGQNEQDWQSPPTDADSKPEDDFRPGGWDDRPPHGWDDPNGDTRPTEGEPPPRQTEPLTETPPTEPLPPETQPVTEPPATEPAAPPASDPETASVTESGTVQETTAPETQPTTETQPPSAASPENPTPPAPREPRMNRWNVPITIDHFAIFVSSEGTFLGLRNTEDYSDEEAESIMNGILAKGKTEGMYGWLQFCTAEKPYGTLLVITDKTSDQGLLNNLFRTTVIVGILMLLVLLVVLIFLSHSITQPVQQAFTRQKQFVSDAGHELKTPVAVLTTNADILQDEIGENKWLAYMQEQIGRMNQLIGDLLRLARMDNAAQEYHFTDFDLSLAVAATTLPFESAAFELHKHLEMDVQPDIRYNGSEQHIRQLCAIFIDNALKYSNEDGTIKVTLLQRGDHQILEFYNTGCEISQEETEKIFERFYRGDKARNSTGKSGYGLGLAIAKSIMEIHKIKFQVTCEQGRWIRFLLTF